MLVMDLATVRPAHSSETASRVIDGEATLVLPRENTVHILNPVGTRIWELADGRRTLADIADSLCEEFEVDRRQAEEDLQAFVQELAGKGMLELRGGPIPQDA
ncbi:MAG: PqqD family protein [Armatimonadota bacterium]